MYLTAKALQLLWTKSPRPPILVPFVKSCLRHCRALSTIYASRYTLASRLYSGLLHLASRIIIYKPYIAEIQEKDSAYIENIYKREIVSLQYFETTGDYC
jgi:hypothetical protein